MVHHLDPRYPVVWRSPSSVQIGVDPPRVVLEDVGVGAERMLAALVSGATRGALQLLARGEDPDALIAALAPALSAPEPPASHGVAVYGSGPTAARVSRLLEENGRWHSGDIDTAPSPDAVVIVSHYVTPPALRGLWLRRDVPHLPVVFSDTGVLIGPLVDPGQGPCLTCVEFHRRDRDIAWPALAAQLVDRTSAADRGTLSAEASTTTVRMLGAAGEDQPANGLVVRIDAETGVRTESVVSQHPHCSCWDLAASAQLGQEAAG